MPMSADCCNRLEPILFVMFLKIYNSERATSSIAKKLNKVAELAQSLLHPNIPRQAISTSQWRLRPFGFDEVPVATPIK